MEANWPTHQPPATAPAEEEELMDLDSESELPVGPDAAADGEQQQPAYEGEYEYEYEYEHEQQQPQQQQDEWEEEEAYHLYDFGKQLTLPELQAADFQCKILGLDRDTHFVQIGGSVFRGKSIDSLGNDLVFLKTPPEREVGPEYDHNHPGRYPNLRLDHVMDCRFRMEPIRLEPKRGATAAQSKPAAAPPTPGNGTAATNGGGAASPRPATAPSQS
ncbi:hypothetical protein H9P43_009918 [Blastocladiella emersonii ATCC 22665]|nr:hypothetical protein H9P43_009918 [Blastocladiella emersonii ATCC 22665]